MKLVAAAAAAVVAAAVAAAGQAEVIRQLYLVSVLAVALSGPLADIAESKSKVAEVEA